MKGLLNRDTLKRLSDANGPMLQGFRRIHNHDFFHKYAIQKEKINTAQTLRLKPKAWSLTDRFVCLSKYPAFKERNATKASLLNPQIIKEITDAFEKISVSCLFVCQNHHQRTSFRHGHRSQSHAF